MGISLRTFGIKSLLAMTAVAVALTACGPGVPTGNIPVPTTQVAQATQQDGFDAGDAAVGAVAGAIGGYMLGKATQPKAAPQTVVVQQPPTTVYRSYPSYKKPWYSPTPKTVTTTTVTRSPTVTQSRTYTSPSRSTTVSRRR